MKLSGKYLIEDCDYSFSKTNINFSSNGDSFKAMECQYEYVDSTSHYTLTFFKEDGTAMVVATSIGNSFTWVAAPEYKIIDFGEEVESSMLSSFVPNCTSQLSKYLKPCTVLFGEKLYSTGLTSKAAPTKQDFAFQAEYIAEGKTLKINKISIGYYSGGIFAYLAYIGDEYVNGELTQPNVTLVVYQGGTDEAPAEGVWKISSEAARTLTLPAATEVLTECHNWFAANTNYKKVAKTTIKGVFSLTSLSGPLMTSTTEYTENIRCCFNYGFRRRDGQGISIRSDGIYLYNDGEWRPFNLTADPVYWQVSYLRAINFGEEPQEVSIAFYEFVESKLSSAEGGSNAWEVIAPTLRGKRKWKQKLSPYPWYYSFYDLDTRETHLVIAGINICDDWFLEGKIVFKGPTMIHTSFDEFGNEIESELCYLQGEWLKGLKLALSDDKKSYSFQTPYDTFYCAAPPGSLEPIDYSSKNYQTDVHGLSFWLHNTVLTDEVYNLGRRAFKQNVTPLEVEKAPANGQERLDFLWEHLIQVTSPTADEELLFAGITPPLQKGEEYFDLGVLYSIASGNILLVTLLLSLLSVVELTEPTEEEKRELIQEIFTPDAVVELSTHSRAVRDWILENTNEVVQKTIPRGTYVLSHDFVKSWADKMLQKYGLDNISNGSYLQPLSFKSVVSETDKTFQGISLSIGSSGEAPTGTMYYIQEAQEEEHIYSISEGWGTSNELSRQITLFDDVQVDEIFFEHFVEHSDYKVVTGEETVVGFRKIKEDFIPLSLTFSSTTQVSLLDTYGIYAETTTNSTKTLTEHSIDIGLQMTPAIAYGDTPLTIVSGYLSSYGETSTANKIVGSMYVSEVDNSINVLYVNNPISRAWIYENTTPITEPVIQQGRYYFKEIIPEPIDWTELEIGFWLEVNDHVFGCSKIGYDSITKKISFLMTTVDGVASESSEWDYAYDCSTNTWYSTDIRSIYIDRNTLVNETKKAWLLNSTDRVSGPRKIKTEATILTAETDITTPTNCLALLKQYGIAISPRIQTIESYGSGQLLGFTPKILYDGTNATQIQSSIYDQTGNQSIMALAVADEQLQVTEEYIVDTLSPTAAQWVVDNTEPSYQIAGCWKLKEADKLSAPTESIEQEITCKMWHGGGKLVDGQKLAWNKNENNKLDLKLFADQEYYIVEDGIVKDWTNNGTARVINFGTTPQFVSKVFYDLINLHFTPVRWSDYEADIDGKWQWKLKPDPAVINMEQALQVNKSSLRLISGGEGENYTIAARDAENNLQILYRAEGGWQDTPWPWSDYNQWLQNLENKEFQMALISDRWIVWDFGENKQVLPKYVYNYITKNARKLDEKTLLLIEEGKRNNIAGEETAQLAYEELFY